MKNETHIHWRNSL